MLYKDSMNKCWQLFDKLSSLIFYFWTYFHPFWNNQYFAYSQNIFSQQYLRYLEKRSVRSNRYWKDASEFGLFISAGNLSCISGTESTEVYKTCHKPEVLFSGFVLWSDFCVFACVSRLSYVNHAEDLASKLLQCSPKNRLSAQAALSHEYFSDLPPRLWELTDSE